MTDMSQIDCDTMISITEKGLDRIKKKLVSRLNCGLLIKTVWKRDSA